MLAYLSWDDSVCISSRYQHIVAIARARRLILTGVLNEGGLRRKHELRWKVCSMYS